MCLAETKSQQAKGILNRLGWQNILESPALGLSGGLIFAWRPGLIFDVLTVSHHFINIVVRSDPVHTPWTTTLIHCPSEWRYKEVFWQELMEAGNVVSGPWLILGDFNALSNNSEKMGGRTFTSSSRGGFYQLKVTHGLTDIGCTGNPFTWCNGRKGYQQIRERLDKGIANGEWALLFP